MAQEGWEFMVRPLLLTSATLVRRDLLRCWPHFVLGSVYLHSQSMPRSNYLTFRVHLLQPILSPSILDHLINNDRKLPPEYNLPHTYVEMQVRESARG